MIETAAQISLVGFAVAMLITLARVVQGSVANRVVALDLLTMIGICVTAVLAVLYRQTWFLDVAIVLSLIAFVVPAAVARYLELRS